MNRDGVRSGRRDKGIPRSSSLVRRALIERLTTLISDEAAARIVDAACAKEGLEWVPERGLVLSLFVHGPLHDEMARVLGEDAAEALVQDLAPMVRMNQAATDPDDSQVRFTFRPEQDKRRPSPGATPLMPPPSVDELRLLCILVATRLEARVDEIATAMGDLVKVQRVDDVLDLFDAASIHASDDVIVVIDARDASVQPSTLAAAHGDLPEHAAVVLWGTGTSESDELEAMVPEASRWARLGGDTSPSELASFLHRMRPARSRDDR